MAVVFEDYSIKCKNAISDKSKQWLEEASAEIEAQAKRAMPQKGQWYAQQKSAFTHKVVDTVGYIGNPMEEALWTEFGTGEKALNGDGRKGYWIYVKGGSRGGSKGGGKHYTSLGEAKRAMAIMQADGIDAHITNGQPPYRPLFNGYNTSKSKIIKLAESLLKGLG